MGLLRDLSLSFEDPTKDHNYETRFLLQKLTYIAKSLGMDVSYDFGLYLNGPYCPSLADDYYKNGNLVITMDSPYSLKTQEFEISQVIKNKILSHPLNQNHQSEFLEAIATILFLKQEEPDLLDDEVFQRVKEIKEYISDKILIIALNTVKMLNFKEKYLTKDIQEELEVWDRAED
jgi:uncharacterized protein YwgA